MIDLTVLDKTEKLYKMVKVIEVFLETGLSDLEIANMTGISSSSVQRYLTDQRTIVELYGYSTYLQIQKKRLENKINGLAKGGTAFAQNNIPIKQEDGKFAGCMRK